MKLTRQLLEAKIKEYLDDMYSFGDEDVETTANILNTMNRFLVESNGEISKKMLLEMADNSQGETQYVMKDFILYMDNV
jgi:hypothetical protein